MAQSRTGMGAPHHPILGRPRPSGPQQHLGRGYAGHTKLSGRLGTALRSIQELQIPGEVGWPLCGRRFQGGALKRSTEMVEHREGGAPSSSRKSLECFRQVTWREGVAGALCSRFARVRVRAAQRSGCSSSGPRARSSRPITGSRRCRRTAPSSNSSPPPRRAGGSSTTIWSSKASLASTISRAVAGEGFIIMRACASPPMGF